MKENFESEYLNKKLEPVNDVLEGNKVADYEEFGEHSYDKESGSFEFTLGETTVSLKYLKPTIEDLKNKKHLSTTLLNNAIEEINKIEDMEAALDITGKVIDEVRVIEEFILKNKDEEYNIGEALGDGKIFFNSYNKPGLSSFLQTETDNVFLTLDPLTPEGLVSLAHEIGHYKDFNVGGDEDVRELIKLEYHSANSFKKAGDLSMKAGLSRLNEKDWSGSAEYLIAHERAAWGFALRDLKPFIKDLKIETKGLDKFVHGRCLQSYSDFIRTIVE
jgi:hypothetical protein